MGSHERNRDENKSHETQTCRSELVFYFYALYYPWDILINLQLVENRFEIWINKIILLILSPTFGFHIK